MAPKLQEKTIRDIAERVPIFDVVSPCVSLVKAGKYYKGLCPFHTEKTPSFTINPERNTFHCFGCNTGGDVYAFYMKFHNVPFMHAVQELARQAGVPLQEHLVERSSKEEEAFRRAVGLNRAVAEFYQSVLLENPAAEPARRYLEGRGIGQEIIREFSLGYAPNAWDGLLQFLSRKRAPLELATALGLIAPRKSGRGHYDRFRNRIMFPITGTTGQVLAFGGRTMDEDGPKYINSPESFLYRKGSVLYGLHLAHTAVRDADRAVLVEGYMDLITLHKGGFRNTVAVLGTSLTVQQIQVLKRYSRNFLLLFDGDDAGKKASFRNLPEFLEKGIRASAVYLPSTEDPDSYLRKEGKEAFQHKMDGAAPLLDLFLREKTESIGPRDPIDQKIALLRDILPLLRKIPDRLEQQFRIRALSERMGIEELFLREELSKHTKDKRKDQEPPAPAVTGNRGAWPPEEKIVCQILIQYPGLIPQLSDANVLDSFSHAALKEFVRILASDYRTLGTVNLPELLSRQDDPDLSALLTALSCREEFTEQEADTALRDSIRRIQKKSLQARLKRLNQKIQEAETQCQKELQSKLTLEKQTLLLEEKSLHT